MKFFIVGTGRCGTSFLRRLLNSHPEVFVLNESHALPLLYERYGLREAPVGEMTQFVFDTRFANGDCIILKNALEAGFEEDEFIQWLNQLIRDNARLTVPVFWDKLMSGFMQKTGKVKAGDKTPDYGAYMALLHRFWPEARFIHVVRDGLATAHSMLRHPGFYEMVRRGRDNWCTLAHGAWQPTQQPVKTPEYADCLALWARRLARINEETRQLGQGICQTVRYEDLVRQPGEVLARIARELSIEPYPEWLDFCATQVSPESLARLQQPKETSLLEGHPLAQDLMQAYGYT